MWDERWKGDSIVWLSARTGLIEGEIVILLSVSYRFYFTGGRRRPLARGTWFRERSAEFTHQEVGMRWR